MIFTTNSAFAACTSTQIDVNGDETNCVTAPFRITTTSSTDTFTFTLSPQGVFYVDCGTGGTLSGTGVSGKTISRTNTTEATYTCSYSSAASRTIKFASDTSSNNPIYYANMLNGENIGVKSAIKFTTPAAIASLATTCISSNNCGLGAIFPTKPGNDEPQPSFMETFKDAVNLTSIPANLFAGLTGAPSISMFYSTFNGCTSLNNVPTGLFSGLSGAAKNRSFYNTFAGCTGFTKFSTGQTYVPVEFFGNITSGGVYTATGMFADTNLYCRAGCTNEETCCDIDTDPDCACDQCPTGTSRVSTGGNYFFHDAGRAICEGTQYTITLNSNSAGATTAGTGAIYAVHDTAVYLDSAQTQSMTTSANGITVPARTGWSFMGYYSDASSGTQYIGSNGKITSNGLTAGKNLTANATWYARFKKTCSAGTYFRYSDTSCQTCPAGSYCPGFTAYNYTATDMGKTECPSGYTSETGQTAITQCFMAGSYTTTCAVANPITAQNHISGGAYATSGNVSCKKYYDANDANPTCVPEPGVCDITGVTCENGYSATQATTPTLTGSITGLVSTSYDAYSEFGIRYTDNASGTRDGKANGEFDTTFSYGTVRGRALCSATYAPGGALGTPSNTAGQYCWCKIEKYKDTAGNWLPVMTGYVRARDEFFTSTATCQSGCSQQCALVVLGGEENSATSSGTNYRDTLYNGGTEVQYECLANTITLNWDENNGSTVTSGTCTYGGNLNLPSTIPTRLGYTFAGWKLKDGTIKSAGATVTGGCVYANTGAYSGTSTEITAQWTSDSYTITYNLDGGTNGANNPTTFTDSDADITLAQPTKSGKIFTGWTITTAPTTWGSGSSVSGDVDFKIATGTSGNITLTATWADPKFTITTSATDSFFFKMSAAGVFYVDWGDGHVQKIDRSNSVSYTQYDSPESWTNTTHTIRFTGVGTGYNTGGTVPAIRFGSVTNNSSADENAEKINSFSGSLGALFPSVTTAIPASAANAAKTPSFIWTFYGAKNMADEIPANLFAGVTAPRVSQFYGTFHGCAGLTGTIPSTLFGDLNGAPAATMFNRTFQGCTGLYGTIPEDLFAGLHGAPATTMFQNTFNGCTGLGNDANGNTISTEYAIPPALFCQANKTGATPSTSNCIYGAPQGSMFSGTFYNCTGLSGKIPEKLFVGINGAPATGMFQHTFYGVKEASIPAKLFAGIHGAPANNMFYGTFYANNNVTEIPEELFCQALATGETPDATNCIFGAPATGMFRQTFMGATKITEIPENLFIGISGAPADNMFYRTFYNTPKATKFSTDSGYVTYVPGDFLENIADGTATNPMYQMFQGSGLASTCPVGTYDVTRSQFEAAVKPWCSPCGAGSTSAAGATACTVCAAGTTTTANGGTTCSACPNADNVSTWATPTWDSTTNTTSNVCVASTCATGYEKITQALPAGYTPIEYIQSSGNSYINTGIVPTDTMTMDMVWYTNNTGSLYMSGARQTTSSTNLFNQTGSSAGGTILAIVNGVALTANTNGTNWARTTSGAKYHTVLTSNNGTFDYYINDYTGDRKYSASENYTPLGTVATPIYIFAVNSSNIAGGTPRIYSYKLTNGGNIVFNGIPAKNSSGVAGLYDTVSGNFFPSSSATAFTAGPEVSDFANVCALSTYTITYVLESGNNPSSAPKTYTVETPTITLPTPTRGDDIFGGWYDNPNFTGNAITTIPIGSTGNKTFYARWIYTLTFDKNGGTGGTNTLYYTDTGVYTDADLAQSWTNPISVPTRAGYTFDGYYYTGNYCGGGYANNTQIFDSTGYDTDGHIYPGHLICDSNMTFVAQWTQCAAGSYCPGDNTSATCAAGTYSAAGASECTPCPAAYPNSAAGATSINECYLTLTAGKYVATAGAGATNCAANNFSDDTTTNIYYGGTATEQHKTTSTCTACSTLGGGLYNKSVAGSASTGCYASVAAGKYLKANTDTAVTACPGNYYCLAQNVYYPNASSVPEDASGNDNVGPEMCPAADSTTQRTSYPDNYYNPTLTSFSQYASTGVNSLATCRALYRYTNTHGNMNVITYYNPTTGKYDGNDLQKYYTKINAGYYGTDRMYNTTTQCTTTSTYYMYYHDVQPCPNGSWCPGIASMPRCNNANYTYDETFGLNTCPDTYPDSAAGSSAQNQCYTACTVANSGITHATAVTGNLYYDGTDTSTCSATACDTGYTGDDCHVATYTVTLNANSGTAGTTSVTATYGSAMPTPITLPTRAGYTFAGYYDTSATTGGTQYYDASGASAHVWDKTADTTLYARWTICPSGSFCPGDNVAYSCSAEHPGYPNTNGTGTSDGNKCWRSCTTADVPNSTAVGGPVFVDGTSSCAVTTCAPGYSKYPTTGMPTECRPNSYNLTLNPNHGTTAGTTSITATYNAAMPTPITLPMRTGYIFAGYYDTDADTGGTQYYDASGASAHVWDKTSSSPLYARWTPCAAGKYCPGDNTSVSCPSGYTSDAGAGLQTQCYKTCTTANVEHSATVTGKDYYGDGIDTCSAATCATGYHVKAGTNPDLTSLLNGASAAGFAYNDGEGNLSNATSYDDSDVEAFLGGNNRYAIVLDSGAVISGQAACSATKMGLGYGFPGENPLMTVSVTDATGQNCYCKTTGYNASVVDTTQNVSSSWVYLTDVESMGENCVEQCSQLCSLFNAYGFAEEENIPSYIVQTKDAITYTSTYQPSTCEADTYTVTLDAYLGTIPSGGTTSVTATYGTAMPAIDTTKLPTRAGYTFTGYYDTSATTGGTQYYRADGTSAHAWDKPNDGTLYARWTICPAGSYCPGDNVAYQCPAEYPNTPKGSSQNATGATAASQCYGPCTLANAGIYAEHATAVGGTINQTGTTNNCSASSCETGYYVAPASRVCSLRATTITLNTNGGYNTDPDDPSSVTAMYGQSMPEIAAPVRYGYVFAGYYDTSATTGGTQYYTAAAASARTWDKDSASTTLYARWTPCTAGKFCPADNTEHTCPSGYSSDTAAGADIQCYKACTTANVEHSATVTGRDYYGNGADTCEPTTCATGYNLNQGVSNPDLPTLIGNTTASDVAYTDTTGAFTNPSGLHDQSYYGITGNNAFGLDFDTNGLLTGYGYCSTQPGDNNGLTWSNPTIRDTLTDQTGQSGANYCYCGLNSYKPSGESAQSFDGKWVYLASTTDAADMCDVCSFYCAFLSNEDSPFRTALFNAIAGGGTLSTCEAATYTITYNLDGGTNNANNPETYTIDSANITLLAPTKDGKIFTGWTVTTAPTNWGTGSSSTGETQFVIGSGTVGNITLTATWADEKFTVTTSATNTFQFRLSAGGTFYVDWGNGIVQKIVKNNTSAPTYTAPASWSNTTHTIKFTGTATEHASSTSNADISFYTSAPNAQKITAISGSLGAIFGTINNQNGDLSQPSFRETFRGCSNLTNIPAGLFSGVSGAPRSYMFQSTFNGCTGLTSIPSGLFGGISGTPARNMFAHTFEGCTGLTSSIPSGLFGNLSGAPQIEMFMGTFQGCSGLTGSIPSGLFGNISGAPARGMFLGTFAYCSGLTGSIPSSLFGSFSGAPAYQMFSGTFANCSGLTGSIPSNLFSGISGAPAAEMYYGTFNGCSGLTGSIPSGLFGTFSGAPAETMFADTFWNCSGLTGSIPSNLFSGISGAPARWMFYETFRGCSGLTGSIPSGLFSGISGAPAYSMFYGTFWDCSRLTGSIPSGLFGNLSGTPADYMFFGTFAYCSGLTDIPSNLFSGISGAPATEMFDGTFYGCTGLTTVPSNLFSGISGTPATNMFYGTFGDCSNLTGFTDGLTTTTYVPQSFLNSITTDTSVSNQASYMFTNTSLAATCPAGTYDVTRTQFNDAGKPWCSPCATNTYSTGNASACTACPVGTYSPIGSRRAAQCGHILHIDDDNISDILYLHSDKVTQPSLNIKWDGQTWYANMVEMETNMSETSDHKFKVQYDNKTYYVCDDTTCGAVAR